MLPYFSPEAKAALEKASKEKIIQVNSGFRTVIQQHMIYSWRRKRRCGISAAARPGRSRHESGRAIDTRNPGTIKYAMRRQGWSRPVKGDLIHFEHLGSPDLSGLDILAFQRLWNRNNPKDMILEDGTYDELTLDRMNRSPADGFRVGAICEQLLGDGEYHDFFGPW